MNKRPSAIETVDAIQSRPRWYKDWISFGLIALSIIAGALSPALPLLYWIAPAFTLLYLDRLPRLIGFLIFFVTAIPLFLYQTEGIIPIPQQERIIMAIVVGIVGFLPYWLQLLVKHRLPSLLVPLVFPAATVVLEFVGSTGPFGTWGSLAYTQFGFSTLMQLASVTGIWGITFLVSWFAAVVWWWFSCPPTANAKLPAGLLSVAMILVLAFSTWRLSSFPSPEHANQSSVVGCVAAPNGAKPWDEIHAWIDASRLDGEPNNDELFSDCRSAVMKQLNYLTRKTTELAESDAKLIVWSEAALVTLPEFEEEIIQQCSEIAKRYGANIAVALAVYDPDHAGKRFFNKSVFISATGNKSGEYLKTKIVPGEPSVAGDGKIPIYDTENLGHVAQIICYDADFPEYVRQASQDPRVEPSGERHAADVLIVSANDWEEVSKMHLEMSATRSIENGLWTVRSTSNGISAVIDPGGKILAQTNSFNTDEPTLIGTITGRRAATIYSIIGDSFAFACIGGLLLLLATALINRMRAKKTTMKRKETISPGQ